MENLKKCEICRLDALFLCYKCKMYLCDNCYKFIHEKKANIDHKKENIDLFVPIEIKCQKHPEDRINLFCLDDKGKIIK